MHPSTYTDFQLSDFLDDDFFVQWVLHPVEATDKFWQSFCEVYPEKQAVLQQAAAIIHAYRAQDAFEEAGSRDAVWKRISASASQPAPVFSLQRFRLPGWIRVAAALVIFAGLLFWFNRRNQAAETITISSAFGEIKKVMLPDSSEVTLNSGSSISFRNTWAAEAAREVSITGEAYFDVRHLNRDTAQISAYDRFVVHCSDIDIEVLGTTFNVNARHGTTNVALLTGKIRIEHSTKKDASKALTLMPGEYAEYRGRDLLKTKKLEKPKQVIRWIDNEIAFTDATLKEIVARLRDNFGYNVEITDRSLEQLKIEGDISVSNVTDLLDVITTTLNVTITQTADKHISISK